MRIILYFLVLGLSLGSKFDSTEDQNLSLSQCQRQCNSNQQCLKDCQKQRQELTKKTVFITLSVLSFCLLTCGCCLICSHPKFRKFRLKFNQRYKQIKKMNSQVNDKAMARDQFIQHLNLIAQLFNLSETHNNFKSYREGVQNIERVTLIATQNQPFLYDIELKGQDSLGYWSATGAIACTQEGVICWFVKQYEEIERRDKQKIGKFLYKSRPSTLESLEGIWYNIETDEKDRVQQQWKLEYIKNIEHEQTDEKILH